MIIRKLVVFAADVEGDSRLTGALIVLAVCTKKAAVSVCYPSWSRASASLLAFTSRDNHTRMRDEQQRAGSGDHNSRRIRRRSRRERSRTLGRTHRNR